MTYRVLVRTLPDKKVVEATSFDTFEAARAEAELTIFAGPCPVEVLVVDAEGQPVHSRLPAAGF